MYALSDRSSPSPGSATASSTGTFTRSAHRRLDGNTTPAASSTATIFGDAAGLASASEVATARAREPGTRRAGGRDDAPRGRGEGRERRDASERPADERPADEHPADEHPADIAAGGRMAGGGAPARAGFYPRWAPRREKRRSDAPSRRFGPRDERIGDSQPRARASVSAPPGPTTTDEDRRSTNPASDGSREIANDASDQIPNSKFSRVPANHLINNKSSSARFMTDPNLRVVAWSPRLSAHHSPHTHTPSLSVRSPPLARAPRVTTRALRQCHVVGSTAQLSPAPRCSACVASSRAFFSTLLRVAGSSRGSGSGSESA